MIFQCPNCPRRVELAKPTSVNPVCYGTYGGFEHLPATMQRVREVIAPEVTYAPLWAIVDQYRRMADNLERQINVVTGDTPEVLPGDDRITAFAHVVQTLAEATAALDEIASAEGRTVGRERAAKARVMARRCERALDGLAKAGEL